MIDYIVASLSAGLILEKGNKEKITKHAQNLFIENNYTSSIGYQSTTS